MRRKRQFHMLLSAQEYRALQWLAERHSWCASGYLRGVINETYRSECEVPAMRKTIASARQGARS